MVRTVGVVVATLLVGLGMNSYKYNGFSAAGPHNRNLT